MTSLAFQNILGQINGLKAERTLRNHPWILDLEKLNLPSHRIFGAPLSRHHPHGRRVRHINGLLDMPICAVFDYDPPTANKRDTLLEEGDGDQKGNVLEPVKPRGRYSSSNLRKLRDAWSNSSNIQTKLAAMKRQNGCKHHLADSERMSFREKLRALAASLGLLSLHGENDGKGQEPVRDRQRTLSSIPALGTVGRTLSRPVTSGSGTDKLPPLRVGQSRFLHGYHQPWSSLCNNSRPGPSSMIRNPRNISAQPGKSSLPTDEGHTGTTPRPPLRYSESTGRLIPPPSRAIRRRSSFPAAPTRDPDEIHLGGCPSGQPDQEEEIEGLVLGILCQLFDVDDSNAVRDWLNTASDSEKAIVLDLVQTALADEGTRRDNLTSGLTEHSRRSEGQQRRAKATGDGDWTNQRKTGGDGAREKGRVDRLVFDHSQPRIRTNQITCLGTKENGQ